MTDFTADDFDSDDRKRANSRPRKNGHIPHRPNRAASLPEWRQWLSNALGLPPEVRVETVYRHGRDSVDPLTIVLSNKMQMRCKHQRELTVPRTLHSFLASESDGVAQPDKLSETEALEVFLALCVLGTAAAKADPVADLHEYLTMFVTIGEIVTGGLGREQRYVTIRALLGRPAFDRGVALDMRNGQPSCRPAVLLDKSDDKRYVRASEWTAYLRHVINQKVDPSALVARMAELDSQRIDPQAWNADRSHKAHVVLYSLPVSL